MTSLQSRWTAQQMIDLERAFAWMVSLGVQVEPSRLEAYRKIAHTWEGAADGRGRLGLRELYPMVTALTYEVSAFITIHEAFGGLPRAGLDGLVVLLDAATRGPIRVDGSRGAVSDPAREALFEALSGAYFRQVASDNKVALDAAGGIGLVHGRHHLGVATCRPGAQGTLETGLATAGARLVRALDDGQGARRRGLIALDASALLAPQAQLPQAGAHVAAEQAADALLADYVDRQMDRIQACLQPMDRRIIGIMVLFATAALADDGLAFFHVGRWSLVWRAQVSFSDADLLGRLRDDLRGDE